MKKQNDDERWRDWLRTLLPGPELPPGFAAGVWRRIERQLAAQNVTLWQLLFPGWSRAGIGWGLATTVLAAAAAGFFVGSRPTSLDLEHRYLTSIDAAFHVEGGSR